MFGFAKASMPQPENALPGRSEEMPVADRHVVLDASMKPPFAGGEVFYLGMGCFWGAERKFWQTPGVISTAVGYGAGFTPNPTYEEVCSGATGHNELVMVAFDPEKVSFASLLQVFWENHDPTQGMRQGNDRGTQYRSGLYLTSDTQRRQAEESRAHYQGQLKERGYGEITTEIMDAPTFYYAEDYHQQYLHKNPQGYCGIGGTGVTCPISWADED